MSYRNASDQTQSKRHFTAKQRRHLMVLSGGVCGSCGCELNEQFHADHVTPYAHGGETTLSNGQALCPKCNLTKGAKSMTGMPTLWPWQKTAASELFQEWKKQDSRPLIAASPGAGKTKFAVHCALHALKNEGVSLVIVIAPRINIKEQWRDDFRDAGLSGVHGEVTNEALRFRVQNGGDPTEGGHYTVFCLTYQQLAQDADLFAQIAKRRRVLTIADEVHHADQEAAFGEALERLADNSRLRLALSGTPFNSSGGALAMCESEADVDEDGNEVRRTKPIYKYSYGDAIKGGVCRPVEFVKTTGQAESVFKSLTDSSVFSEVYDLSKKKTSLAPFLRVDSEFFEKMLDDGLRALTEVKRGDRRAGMLVVARNRDHGAAICRKIKEMKARNSEWSTYTVQELYHDTEKAHERITQLAYDNIDIVVTVRMISEGVDVKRLRVGLYATDYATRMFFTQFVGRFIRWESRLDAAQHARVIIPGHPSLLHYAREIEEMVEEAEIETGGWGPPPPESKKELLENNASVEDDGLIYRGEDEDNRDIVKRLFDESPTLANLRGYVPETQAARIAKELGIDNTQSGEEQTSEEPSVDWYRKNDRLVAQIAKMRVDKGYSDKRDFDKINKWANEQVGIRRKDKMTPDHVLQKRHECLRHYARKIQEGHPEEVAV